MKTLNDRVIALANSEGCFPEETSDMPSLANFAEDGDGWALIARYGEWKHKGRANENVLRIQKFTKEDAVALVNSFKAGSNRIRRAVMGAPVFDGHSDAPGYEHIWPDKKAYGMFSDLAARDDGLYGRLVLSNAGGRLVEDGKDRLSPYWLTQQTGTAADGTPIVTPFKLVSVALVPKGNIPGPSLMNAAPSPAIQTTMNKKLLELLKRLGLTVAADAGEADLANAIDQGLTALATTTTALANATAELTTVKAKVTTLEGEKVALANSAAAATTLTADLTNARTALAAERKERVLLLVNAAFTEGRLPATERDATITALCNAADFAAEAGKLAARTKIINTNSKTDELARKRGESGSKSQQVLDLVNARMETRKENYEVAYAQVMLTPEYQALMAPAAK